MKFITFEVKTPVGSLQRIGVLRDGDIVDLHAAYAAYLRAVRSIYGWRELAQALVPPDMLRFIEDGEMCIDAGSCACS